MKERWTRVPFTEVATLRRREINVEQDGVYPEVGVRSFGRGLFRKPPRSGLEVGDKRLFRLKCGDLIIQITFAWEGAVALVAAEDEAFYGSVRVLTFEVDEEKCDGRFLLWYFRTKQGVEQLARISPGSAGRNRVLATRRLGEIVVPLPPLLEQRRLISDLEAVEGRLTRTQRLREEQEHELQAALHSAFHHLEAHAQWKPMSEVAPLAWRRITIDTEASYTEYGVRSFYKGVFFRRKVSGSAFSWQELYRLQTGDLVFSNIMAWEKAIAVAGSEHDGWVGNHRMLVCEPRRDLVLASCLQHYFMTAGGFVKVLQASPGTAARNKTLKASDLMAIQVPVPPMSDQRAFEALCQKAAQLRAIQGHQTADMKAIVPSMLDGLFGS